MPNHVIAIKHNIEMAHRLFTTPGKCEQIHGHSMWVTMEFSGSLDDHGFMNGLEYGQIKREYRGFLDTMFDHKLVLNEDDPWTQSMLVYGGVGEEAMLGHLPGLQTVPGDPTTENMARWIAEWGVGNWSTQVSSVTVWETAVNMARWER